MTQLTDFQNLIALSRYCRWDDAKQRRETWEECVARMVDFWQRRVGLTKAERDELFNATHGLEVMGSQRMLWVAGEPVERDEASAYNCAFINITDQACFSEIMYNLMLGVGQGFSVERQYVSKLPEVSESFHESETVIVVEDSRIGWCKALKQLLAMLWEGEIPWVDYSRVRPAGERLQVFGGRASGSEPLKQLFEFCVRLFKNAAGRRLESSECHDICTMIGQIVISGSVRRSAEISLGNLSDDRHRRLKSGDWWVHTGHRAMANNSAVYDGPVDFVTFQHEMLSMYESFSGERGIFNRVAAQKKAAKIGRDPEIAYGVNPCAEIILRGDNHGRPGGQFCNLSEVIIRPDDTLSDLKRKVRIAAIYGTMQSSLTNFRFLRKGWQNNCEEERLLGVSFTGICDHQIMGGKRGHKILGEWLQELHKVAKDTNVKWAKRLGINPSAAITAIKPSGTVSLLCDTSSGIHPRFSELYQRTIRQDKKDKLCSFLIDQGVPHEDCVMKPDTTVVFSFPQKSPKGSICTAEVGPIEQLELAKTYNQHWADHTVSLTCYYSEHNWYDTMSWVHKNFDYMIGVSFLPLDAGSYQQAPYTALSVQEYKDLVKRSPKIDWSKLAEYEQEDATSGSQEFACVGDSCEL